MQTAEIAVCGFSCGADATGVTGDKETPEHQNGVRKRHDSKEPRTPKIGGPLYPAGSGKRAAKQIATVSDGLTVGSSFKSPTSKRHCPWLPAHALFGGSS